jgi:ankyrin repeat protein
MTNNNDDEVMEMALEEVEDENEEEEEFVDLMSDEMYDAINEGDLALVGDLLDAGESANGLGPNEATPLLWALSFSQLPIAKLLFERGSDIAMIDEDGRNALHYSVNGGCIETVIWVLESSSIDVNFPCDEGKTPLMLALRNCRPVALGGLDYFDIVKLLAQRGADIEGVTSSGDTALHSAAIGGGRDVIDWVRENTTIDVNAINSEGQTPSFFDTLNSGSE